MCINVALQTIGELFVQDAGVWYPVAGRALGNNLVLALVAVRTAQILVQGRCPRKKIGFRSVATTAER